MLWICILFVTLSVFYLNGVKHLAVFTATRLLTLVRPMSSDFWLKNAFSFWTMMLTILSWEGTKRRGFLLFFWLPIDIVLTIVIGVFRFLPLRNYQEYISGQLKVLQGQMPPDSDWLLAKKVFVLLEQNMSHASFVTLLEQIKEKKV